MGLMIKRVYRGHFGLFSELLLLVILQNHKKKTGCLGYIGDEILPRYIRNYNGPL